VLNSSRRGEASVKKVQRSRCRETRWEKEGRGNFNGVGPRKGKRKDSAGRSKEYAVQLHAGL
jgi:hypothetical protein